MAYLFPALGALGAAGGAALTAFDAVPVGIAGGAAYWLGKQAFGGPLSSAYSRLKSMVVRRYGNRRKPKGTRLSGRIKKNAGRGVRPRARGRPPADIARGRKRTAAAEYYARKKRRVGMRKRVRSVAEFNNAGRTTVFVNRCAPIDRKILKTCYQRVINRWQRANAMTSGAAGAMPGSLPMSHSTSGTSTNCPLWMVCLNQIRNGTVTLDQGPVRRLSFNDTGAVTWNNWASLTNTGAPAADNDWQVESYDPELSGDPVRHAMIPWLDIRMQLYGCTAQPTVYEISVVSFIHTYLDPYESPSNTQEAADRHAVYQGLVQPFMFNPILPSLRARPKIKYHYRSVVTLQSTLNTENDPDPRCVTKSLFIRDGGIYDYRYHNDGFSAAGADDALSTGQWIVQGALTNDYVNRPLPRARKYLMIRALNTTRVDTASENASNTPSFDIVIRQCQYKKLGN